MADIRSLRPTILNITKPKATTNSELIQPDTIAKEDYSEIQRLSGEAAALDDRNITASASRIRG
jgi:hypothetical protein